MAWLLLSISITHLPSDPAPLVEVIEIQRLNNVFAVGECEKGFLWRLGEEGREYPETRMSEVVARRDVCPKGI